MSRKIARKAPSSSSPAVAAAAFQTLEARQLLSATLRDGGQLVITGTPGRDVVSVGLDPADATRLVVTEKHRNHPTHSTAFRFNRVFRIEANLGNGNDVFNVDDTGGIVRRRKVIYGDAGNDSLTGGGTPDVLYGGGGNDTLVGRGGDDVLIGQNGADVLDGGQGDDALYGGNGDDKLGDTSGTNLLDGGNGVDTTNGVVEVVPPPATPSNFTAAPTSSSRIRLNWTDLPDETAYKVERSPDGTNNWTVVGTPAADAVTFLNTGLSANTTYYYRLSASNVGGSSAPTAVVSATTTDVPPVAPVNFNAIPTTNGTIQLSWADLTNETGYRLERSPDGVNWVLNANLPADSTSQNDNGLGNVTTYYYRIRGFNALGNGAFSAIVSATTNDPNVTVPATPANFTATATSATDIQLAWDDVATEDGYYVEHNDGSGWVLVATLPADTIAYTDTGLTGATTYTYRLRAFNTGGRSPLTSAADTTL
jgi:hypothetical protein